MANWLLSHKFGFETHIESKELLYFVESIKSRKASEKTRIYYALDQIKSYFWSLKLFSINLETNAFKEYKEINYKAWIFNLPHDEKLIVERNSGSSPETINFCLLNQNIWRGSLMPNFYVYEAIFYNRCIYIFGKCSQWCKIIKKSGGFRRSFKWKKMPGLKFNSKSYASYVGYFNKLLVTSNDWNSIYLYDRTVNSYSEVSLILRDGYKILAAHDLKIYIISFPGSIYVNYSGNLDDWNILSINSFDFDLDHQITYTFFNKGFYIANNRKFYKFDFCQKMAKLEILQ